jgi:hypothetical protein
MMFSNFHIPFLGNINNLDDHKKEKDEQEHQTKRRRIRRRRKGLRFSEHRKIDFINFYDLFGALNY